MSAFTADELAREAWREVRQRQWTYSRLIEEGKMSKHIAERKIALMETIAVRLQAEADALEPRLL